MKILFFLLSENKWGQMKFINPYVSSDLTFIHFFSQVEVDALDGGSVYS